MYLFFTNKLILVIMLCGNKYFFGVNSLSLAPNDPLKTFCICLCKLLMLVLIASF